MNINDFKSDVEKFCDYLATNGVHLVCGLLVVDTTAGNRLVLKAGDKDGVLYGFASAALDGTDFEIRKKGEVE